MEHKIDKPSFIETVNKALKSIQCDGSINGSAEHISLSLKAACERLLLKSSANKYNRSPWWNVGVTISRCELKHAHRRTLQLNTPESRESFRKAGNIHVSNVRKAKKLIWHTLAEDPIITGNAWGKLTKWLIKGKRYFL